MLPEDFLAAAWFIKAMLYSAFAALGGLLGHLFRSLDSGNKVTLYASCIKSFGAAFSGFLVFLFCSAIELDEAWTGITVGVFGWLGADATIMLLERVVLHKLGVPLGTRKKDTQSKDADDVQ